MLGRCDPKDCNEANECYGHEGFDSVVEPTMPHAALMAPLGLLVALPLTVDLVENGQGWIAPKPSEWEFHGFRP